MRRRAWTIRAAIAVLLALAGSTACTADEGPSEPTGAGSSPQPSASSAPSEPTPSRVTGRSLPCELTTRQGEMPDEFWGMHASGPEEEVFPTVPVGRVNATTAGTYWPSIEVAPGQLDFSPIDRLVEAAGAADSRVTLVMGFSPTFHSTGTGATARAEMPRVEAWEGYVRRLAERYGSRIDYQVWPEPNIVGNWTGTPQQMAELTVRAGRVLEEVAPDATLVAPALALRLGAQQRWMDDFFGATVEGDSVGDVIDAVAVDPFPLEDGTPEDSVDLLCDAQRILDSHGVGAPIWTNEINYGVPSGGGATDVQQYPPEQQAAWVARTYLLHAAVGVDSVHWLGWGTYPGMAISMAQSGQPSPAAGAYAAVRRWLVDRERPTCTSERGVYTCQTDERVVWWSTRGGARVDAPPGASALEALDGQTTPIVPGDPVEVGASPVSVRIG